MGIWVHHWYMIDDCTLLCLYPTSMPYAYKVVLHIDMLWMGIWVHPYTVTFVQVGVDFRKIYVGLGPSDVVRSWLRLQTCIDCIPHPYHMYTKCFNTLMGPRGNHHSHIY